MGIIKTIIVGGEGLTEKQEKIRKLFMYLVSGCLTTAVNWICYVAFDKLVKADMAVSLFGKEFSLKFIINQIVCFIIAVIVAYFLNRVTVFRSKGNVFRELLTFFGARILSFLVLEIGVYSLMIWACVSITGLPIDTPMAVWQIIIWPFAFTYEYLCKLINSVFIMIANYVMSKVMVFKKKDMIDYNADENKPEAYNGIVGLYQLTFGHPHVLCDGHYTVGSSHFPAFLGCVVVLRVVFFFRINGIRFFGIVVLLLAGIFVLGVRFRVGSRPACFLIRLDVLLHTFFVAPDVVDHGLEAVGKGDFPALRGNIIRVLSFAGVLVFGAIGFVRPITDTSAQFVCCLQSSYNFILGSPHVTGLRNGTDFTCDFPTFLCGVVECRRVYFGRIDASSSTTGGTSSKKHACHAHKCNKEFLCHSELNILGLINSKSATKLQ